MKRAFLKSWAQKIGVTWEAFSLAELALSPKSELTPLEKKCWERAEFLGDSILSFVMTLELEARFKEMAEGELSKMKHFLTSTHLLAQVARFYQLDTVLQRSPALSDKKLADVIEVLIYALYKNYQGDIEKMREIVVTLFLTYDAQVFAQENLQKFDFKSLLQERCMQRGTPPPHYESVEVQQGCFVITLQLGERNWKLGGHAKKHVEQLLAQCALEEKE